MTPSNPGGLRADSAATAAPPADTPMTIMRVASASGRRAIAASVACRSSASEAKRPSSEGLAQESDTGGGPSEAP